MILTGKLINAKREAKKFKNGKTSDEKLFITLAEVAISDEKMAALNDAFKDSGKNFTPDWINNFEGYVNVSTKFELPVRLLDGTEASLEDAIADGFKWMGAEVKLSLNVKEGAIYPNALVVIADGKAVNAFSEFDKED